MSTTKIGLGLAAIGRPEYINLRQDSDPDKTFSFYRQKAFDIFDFAYKRGVRNFDTAASYGKGEDFLIDWHHKNGYRDVVLSSKWGYTYVANWEIGFQGPHEIKEHTLEKLNEQWSKSQQLLPELQIYQIHSATFESGVLENEQVLQRLHELKTEVGIKIGLSVSGKEQASLLETASSIKVEQMELFDSFQVTYNILERSSGEVVNHLLRDGKTVIVKEALANGRLLPNDAYTHYNPLYKKLSQLSEKYQVGPDAIALRFVIDRLNPTIVLSGASSISHLNENLKALDFKLSDQELQDLSSFKAEPGAYWKERNKLEWN